MIPATVGKLSLCFLLVMGFVQALSCAGAVTGDAGLAEAEGRVSDVSFLRHRHGASVLLESEAGSRIRVWLGSDRYLIEQDFVPKVGEVLKVSGLEIGGSQNVQKILATSVTRVSSGRSLDLPHPPEAAALR